MSSSDLKTTESSESDSGFSSDSSESNIVLLEDAKFDENFILRISKKKFTSEEKARCKVLKFSYNKFNDALKILLELKCEDYPSLFIFIIESEKEKPKNEHEQELKKHFLEKYCNRPLIFQIKFDSENYFRLFYKDEESKEFSDYKQHQQMPQTLEDFPSLLWLNLSLETDDFEEIMVEMLPNVKNSALILRFLRALEHEDDFFNNLILKCAREGNKNDFLAILDARYENDQLSPNAQDILMSCIDDESVLRKALENKNEEIVFFLIYHCSHLINNLPLDEKIKISSFAFKMEKFDVLCDLLEIAEFPFPENIDRRECERHEKLYKLVKRAEKFSELIVQEKVKEMSEILNMNANLKHFYNLNNQTALNQALEFKKFKIFFYLKSHGFQGIDTDEIWKSLTHEETYIAKAALKRTQEKIINALIDPNYDDINSDPVGLLYSRSLIHNTKINRDTEEIWRRKIMQWYQDINKVAPYLINAVALCDELKIIFDFESSTTDRVDLATASAFGVTYYIAKRICIGAKSHDENSMQKIKGIIAHELCHYTMILVYNNNFRPYYEYCTKKWKMFDAICQMLDEWSFQDYENPDDECNGRISAVFQFHSKKHFHDELIARVPHILAEFDNNEEKLNLLEEKYKTLFMFWNDFVIPDIERFYLNERKKIKAFNDSLKIKVTTEYELHKLINIEELFSAENFIIVTNVPKLFFTNLYANFGEQFYTLCILIKPIQLKDREISDKFNEILKENQGLKVFFDCTKETEVNLEKIVINKKHLYFFIVSSSVEQVENLRHSTSKIWNHLDMIEQNFCWDDLTEQGQEMLLKTKISFQNSITNLSDLLTTKQNIDEVQEDLIEQEYFDLSEVIDDGLLNILEEKAKIELNTRKNYLIDRDFKQIEENLRFLKNTETKEYSNEITQQELLLDVKDETYVILIDNVSVGKSWIIKNIENELTKLNSKKWISCIDLKQFSKEFKKKSEVPEFATYLVENLLKLQHAYEGKIFKKLYNDGKVCILFDGIDEITPNCAEFVTKLVKNFQSNGGNQLWITMRDCFEFDLKKLLNLDISYNIKSMTNKECLCMIVENWIIDLMIRKNLIKFDTEFNQYIEDKTQQSYSFYRLAICLIENIPLTNVESIKISWPKEQSEQRISCLHLLIAIKQLFPDHLNSNEYKSNFDELSDEEIKSCNLLTRIDKDWVFQNETLCEYIAAIFIYRLLQKTTLTEWESKILIQSLTNHKYSATRMFLNDLLSNSSIENKVEEYIQKYIKEFYETESFGELFVEDLEILANSCMSAFENGDYQSVKNIFEKYTVIIMTRTTSATLFEKFKMFLVEFLLPDDLKDLLTDKLVFQRMIQSNVKIEVLSNFISTVLQKVDQQFIAECLSLNDSYNLDGNIFYLLIKSPTYQHNKMDGLLKIFQTCMNDADIFKLLKNCNQHGENILQIATSNKHIEFHIDLWNILQKFDNYKDKLAELVLQKNQNDENFIHLLIRYSKQDIIQYTFKKFFEIFDKSQLEQALNPENLIQFAIKYSKDIQVHNLIWKFLRHLVKSDTEIVKLLTQKDKNGRNIFENAITQTTSPIVELIFEKFEKIYTKVNVKELLQDSSDKYENIFQIASRYNNDPEVHKLLWKVYHQHINEPDILKLTNLYDGDRNILLSTIEYNTKEIVEKVWNNIRKIIRNKEDLIEYFLPTKLVEASLKNKLNPDVQMWVNNLMREYQIELGEESSASKYDIQSRQLINASKMNYLDAVENLLLRNVDVDYDDENQRNAIDYAWLNYENAKNEDKETSNKIMLKLLKVNSKFPKSSLGFTYKKASHEIQEFANIADKIREDLSNELFTQVKKQILSHPNLCYFYDFKNQSLLWHASKLENMKIFNLLVELNLTIGSHENIDDVFKKIRRAKVGNIQKSENVPKIPKAHIWTLLSKSELSSNKNFQKEWSYVKKAYTSLDRIKFCSAVLKIVALSERVKVVFDFNKSSKACSYNLKSSAFSHDTSINSDIIYINAMDLMDDKQSFGEIKILFHNLLHYLLVMTHMNEGNPYLIGDLKEKERFEYIFENVRKRFKSEQINDPFIKNVFEYPENCQHSELVVTILQIRVSNQNKIESIEQNFPELHKYISEKILQEIGYITFIYKKLNDQNQEVSFEHLTEPMKAKILHSKIVFQNAETSIYEMIGNDEEILNSMPTNIIRRIIQKNKKIAINEEITLESLMGIVKVQKDDMMYISLDSTGRKILADITEIEVSLEKMLKQKHTSHIKLTNYELLKIYKVEKSEPQIDSVLDFLMKALNLKSQFELFIFKSYFCRGKAALVFSEIDRMNPEVCEYFLKMVSLIRKYTHNTISLCIKKEFWPEFIDIGDQKLVLWKNNEKEIICETEIHYDHDKLLSNFFCNSIKKELNADIFNLKDDLQNVIGTEINLIKIESIMTKDGSNLMMIAAKKHTPVIVGRLLEYNFDINYKNTRSRNTVDYAWINFEDAEEVESKATWNELILNLLDENSRFPSRLVNFDYENASENIKQFIDKCERLHQSVEKEDIKNLKVYLDESPHLYHFFDRYNESLLVFALKCSKTKVLEALNGRLSIDNCEILDDIYYEIPGIESVSKRLNIPPSHVQQLKAKSLIKSVRNDREKQKKMQIVQEVFMDLERDPLSSKVIQILAEWKPLKIIFEFNHSSLINSAKTIVTDFDSRIQKSDVVYIAAKNLTTKDSSTWNYITSMLIYDLTQIIVKLLGLKYLREIDDPISELQREPSTDDDHNSSDQIVEKVLSFYQKNQKSSHLSEYLNAIDIDDLLYILKLLQNYNKTIKYDKLLEPMKAKILHFTIKFQSVETTLSDIVEDKHGILNFLTQDQIRGVLMQNKSFFIGEDHLKQHRYINRNFIEINSNETKTSGDVIQIMKSSTIFVLADDNSTGKTTTFKSLSGMLQKELRNFWVSIIDLHKHHKVLDSFRKKEKEINLDEIVKLLMETKTIKLELEVEIFKKLFNRNRAILIFDDIDKIDEDTGEYVIKMLKFMQTYTSNILCISTRHQLVHQLLDLDTVIFKHDQLSWNEKKQLILNIFERFKLKNSQIPLELKEFIDILEADCGKSINNIQLIESIAELYANNKLIFESNSCNLFNNFEKLFDILRMKFIEANTVKSDDLFKRFSLFDVHIVYALRMFFANFILDDFAIMRLWKREKRHWGSEEIRRFGFLWVDLEDTENENSSIKFIHDSIAYFFVVKYFTTTLYYNDFIIDKSELRRTFLILRTTINYYDKFILLNKFLMNYIQINITHVIHKRSEKIKEIIADEIPNIHEDMLKQKYPARLLEFWSFILCYDAELLRMLWDVNSEDLNSIITTKLKSKDITDIFQKISNMINVTLCPEWRKKLREDYIFLKMITSKGEHEDASSVKADELIFVE